MALGGLLPPVTTVYPMAPQKEDPNHRECPEGCGKVCPVLDTTSLKRYPPLPNSAGSSPAEFLTINGPKDLEPELPDFSKPQFLQL